MRAVAEEHHTDLSNVEVQRDTEQSSLELQQLVGHRRVEAFDAGNAIADLRDATNFFSGGGRRVRRDVPLDRIPDLFRPDRQLRHGVLLSFVGPAVRAVCGVVVVGSAQDCSAGLF